MKTPPDHPLPQPSAAISPDAGIPISRAWQLSTNGAELTRDLPKQFIITRIVAEDAEAPQPAPTPTCSGFFVRGWARAYTKIAGTNQIESSERARGIIYGEEYRRYWATMRAKAHMRMRTAAKTAGAKLSFGAFNSVEIHIPNVELIHGAPDGSNKLAASSPLDGAACSDSSDTPETNRFYESFADGDAIPNQDEWLALCERLELARNAATAVIEAIEERYIDGWDTYEDWKFMGDTAREFLRPNV